MAEYLFDGGYNTDVTTILHGMDLSKYVDKFNSLKVDNQLFSTLTDEDLCSMGVNNPDDRQKLLSTINRSVRKKEYNDEEEVTLSDKEVLTIMTNSLRQIALINHVLAEFRMKIKATKVQNVLFEKHTVASMLCTLSDEALGQNAILLRRLKQLENLDVNEEVKPIRYADRRRLCWTVFTASALFVVTSLFTLHLMRRRN